MMVRKVRVRTLLLGTVCTLLFIGLLLRIYWVQVVVASDLFDLAQKQWMAGEILPATRGNIVDRRSQILAEDGPAYTVAVNPQIILSNKKQNEVVKGLASIIGTSEETLVEYISKTKEDGTLRPWVEIRLGGWKIDSSMADQLKELFKPFRTYGTTTAMAEYGVYLIEERKRYYPANQMASHLLGYFDKDGKAIMGLEAYHDDILKGVDGKITYQKDGQRLELPDAKVSLEPQVDGNEIRLTIDRTIQSYIETAMEEVFTEFKPKSMTVIAADPNTMEILGMANLPHFNPNQYWSFSSQADFTNHAVQSQYEPGSTFKLVTLAGAIEEGLYDPEETFQSGTVRVANRTIHDHNFRGWGVISFHEALLRSSNVGYVKLGEKLGAEKLTSYAALFGFGEQTGIDLPSEAKGILNINPRILSDTAVASFGQGPVLVNSMQMVAAYAAIANGGTLMRPFVMKEIVNPKTKEVLETTLPKAVRQVVSKQTAKQLSQYLEEVVSDPLGTGRRAAIEGYQVAGKTGTAQKVINGIYSIEKYIVSFIGYAPVEDPKIIIYVVADEPELQGDYRNGGLVTFPVFRDVMAKSLRYLNIPTIDHTPIETGIAISNVEEEVLLTPLFTDLTIQQAKQQLRISGLNGEFYGRGQHILAQFPPVGSEISDSQRIYMATSDLDTVDLPDLTGKSLREALEICSFIKVVCRPYGEGYVTNQAASEAEREYVLELIPIKHN